MDTMRGPGPAPSTSDAVADGGSRGDLGRFFYGAPILAATANAEGYLDQLGGAWQDVLGWSVEELTSRPFVEFVHPEDVPSTLEALDALIEGDRVAGFDNRYRTADGRWVWLRWHAGVDALNQIFAVAWDVTAEVEAQRDLSERTSLLEQVTDLQRAAIEAQLDPTAIGALVESLASATGARDGLVATVVMVDGYPVLRPVWASTGFDPLMEPVTTEVVDPTGLSDHQEIRDLNTLVGAVVRTNQPVRSDHPTSDPRRGRDNDVDCDRLVALPLLGGGELRGVLALTDVDTDVDSHTARLLDTVGVTLAAVLDQLVVRRRAEETTNDLARLSNLLTAVIHDLDGMVVVSGPDGTIRFANRAAERLFGVGSDELAGAFTPAAFVVPGPDGRGQVDYLEWLQDPDHTPTEWAFAGPDGRSIPVLVRPSVLRDHEGRPDGWVQLGTELTARKQFLVEQSRSASLASEVELLRERERELGLLAEAIKYVMSSATIDDALCVVESFAPRILPRDHPVVLSIGDRDCAGGGEIRGIDASDCWALRTGATHVSRIGRAIRCAHLPERGSFACIPLSDGEHQVATLSVMLPVDSAADGTRSRATQQRAEDVARQMGIALSYLQLRRSLEQQASVDALTGVGNRRVAEGALDAAILASRSTGDEFGLLLFDLDGFKSVNDEQGHHVGDRVLRDVSGVLAEHVRPGDTVARLGGDEFVVVLRNLSEHDTARVAELLRREVQLAVRLDADRPCTTSVGALHVPGGAAPASRLMALADAALYRAKEAGRNRVEVATARGPVTGEDVHDRSPDRGAPDGGSSSHPGPGSDQ